MIYDMQAESVGPAKKRAALWAAHEAALVAYAVACEQERDALCKMTCAGNARLDAGRVLLAARKALDEALAEPVPS